MAKNNAVQIKHTKKGMKKLLRNLYLLLMKYVSVGIHKADNKTTSEAKQKKVFNTGKNEFNKWVCYSLLWVTFVFNLFVLATAIVFLICYF